MAKRAQARFIKHIGVDNFVNPYTFRLRPAEVAILTALEQHETIDIKMMEFMDRQSMRVQVCRLRKKLPKGVSIKALYGGYYFMSLGSKEILKQHRRQA